MVKCLLYGAVRYRCSIDVVITWHHKHTITIDSDFDINSSIQLVACKYSVSAARNAMCPLRRQCIRACEIVPHFDNVVDDRRTNQLLIFPVTIVWSMAEMNI